MSNAYCESIFITGIDHKSICWTLDFEYRIDTNYQPCPYLYKHGPIGEQIIT